MFVKELEGKQLGLNLVQWPWIIDLISTDVNFFI